MMGTEWSVGEKGLRTGLAWAGRRLGDTTGILDCTNCLDTIPLLDGASQRLECATATCFFVFVFLWYTAG